MALKFIRQLYALDTLDTRFVVPANVSPKEALQEAEHDAHGSLSSLNDKGKSREFADGVNLPRWKTLEFYFYYVSIALSIMYMFKANIDVSQSEGCNARQRIHAQRLQRPILIIQNSRIYSLMAGYRDAKWCVAPSPVTCKRLTPCTG